MKNKYEIINDDCIDYKGKRLCRIRALYKFGNVEQGDIGGFIEQEQNLLQYGRAWIYDDAMVFGNALIFGDAKIYEKAIIFGNAWCFDDAKVHGEAKVYDDAKIYGHAEVYGHARVCQSMIITTGTCTSDLEKDIKESIRCQTGLLVFNNKIIAYKQVANDLTSFYDRNFKYEVGRIVRAENVDLDHTKSCCTSGLHFSNAHHWNVDEEVENSTFLVAEILLKDIIAVQEGEIRCSKAKIIGKYRGGINVEN